MWGWGGGNVNLSYIKEIIKIFNIKSNVHLPQWQSSPNGWDVGILKKMSCLPKYMLYLKGKCYCHRVLSPGRLKVAHVQSIILSPFWVKSCKIDSEQVLRKEGFSLMQYLGISRKASSNCKHKDLKVSFMGITAVIDGSEYCRHKCTFIFCSYDIHRWKMITICQDSRRISSLYTECCSNSQSLIACLKGVQVVSQGLWGFWS